MYLPDPILVHLSRRDPSLSPENNQTIAWVATIIVASVLIIGIWCVFKVWGSRARNFHAEQELGVQSLPPPIPRLRRFGRSAAPQEEFLPVYDASGRPPAFSPPGMPPPAYLPGDATGREVFRREGPVLGTIAEKDEEVEEKKEAVETVRSRRGSV
jgi:hypothetical protein